ncbi:MAG: hypothetical protein JWM41_1229 [Gemmatimonadetes bacterium]|nr:hypothetical protein [Gemmatimonadota bacterium]
MIRRIFCLAALALLAGASRPPLPLVAPPPVPREFRAAWATPIWDRGFRDWPSKAGLSPDEQRAELRQMLDKSAAAGLNAVILHVRIAGDALYPTPLAPWSAFLSEKQGEAPKPAYDPLAYAVAEAHARGLQLHAWFNPFRAMMPPVTGKAAATHVTRTHPEWIRKYGTQVWIDPGEPAARKLVLETLLDVAKRYDVDGIHIDDYFYPYREARTVTRRVRGKRVRSREDIPFPDDKTWKKYGKAEGFTDRDAWRRANINDFVEQLYKQVKAVKPAMLVGISPFGIWRPGNPRGITGLDSYSEIYADSKKWLAEGWLDYLVPQLYWEVGSTQDRFRVLDAWWRSVNPHDRHVWPGLYTSHVYYGRDAWPKGAIREQIMSIRDSRIGSPDVPGHVHFRLGALFAENNRLAADLLSAAYSERAIVPAFPWLGAAVPAPPVVTVTKLLHADGPSSLTIASGDATRVRWWLIQTRGRDGRWTTTMRIAADAKFASNMLGTADPDEVAVTSISTTGVASLPTLVAP